MSLEEIINYVQSGCSFKKYPTIRGTMKSSTINEICNINTYHINKTSFKIISQFEYDSETKAFTFKKHTLQIGKQSYESELWYDQLTPTLFIESKISNYFFLPYMKLMREFRTLQEQTEWQRLKWDCQSDILALRNPYESWMKDYRFSPTGFHNRYGDFLYDTFITYHKEEKLAEDDLNLLTKIYNMLYIGTYDDDLLIEDDEEIRLDIDPLPTMAITEMTLRTEQYYQPMNAPFPIDFTHSVCSQEKISLPYKAKIHISSDQNLTEEEVAKITDWAQSEIDRLQLPLEICVKLTHN